MQIDIKQLLDIADLQEGARVADLGCGSSGAIVFEAAKRVGEKGRVYAVDILKSALEAVVSMRKILPAWAGVVETVWSDLEKPGATAIPGQSLDAAFFVNVLNQSAHQGELLKEAARLLKPNGMLVMVDWDRLDVLGAPQVAHKVFLSALKETAQATGLVCAGTFAPSNAHFGVKFLKSAES